MTLSDCLRVHAGHVGAVRDDLRALAIPRNPLAGGGYAVLASALRSGMG